jgi:prepilin-type N-terminal cleavage/methylation domain-containing protein
MKLRRAPSGFTLVELVMVLVVVSLLAGLAIPRYSTAAVRYRLKAAAHRVAEDVALARGTARSRSQAVVMSFNRGAGYYEIPQIKGMNGAATYLTRLGSDPYGVAMMSVDFAGAEEVTFNGFGIGTSGQICLAVKGYACTVDVEGNTGVVTITGP